MVAIIGVLAAVAIPAYQKYQKDARIGVIESALQQASRTIALQKSLGKDTKDADLVDLVKSPKLTLDIDSAGAAAGTVTATETDWCVEVTTAATDYKYNRSCIDSDNNLYIKVQEAADIPTGITGASKTTCSNAGKCS